MNKPLKHFPRAADTTAQIGHNRGPEMVVQRMLEMVGPRQTQKPSAFQCGAPWTAMASDSELKRLGTLQGRIERREAALRQLRKERTKIMMRCVRRMRRERGVE